MNPPIVGVHPKWPNRSVSVSSMLLNIYYFHCSYFLFFSEHSPDGECNAIVNRSKIKHWHPSVMHLFCQKDSTKLFLLKYDSFFFAAFFFQSKDPSSYFFILMSICAELKSYP